MVLKKLMLSALLLSSLSAHAEFGRGENRPGNPNRPTQPSRPTDPWGDRDEQQSQARSIEIDIRNYFTGQTTIDALSDQYTRTQLRGLRIKDITIIASTERGQGTATLLLNGQSLESSQVVARQTSAYLFRVDPFANVVGQSLRTIEFGLQGRFYVEKIVFNIFENSGPNGPGPNHPPRRDRVEVIRQQLNEHILGEGGLSLFRMFNLGAERQGQVVRRVTILARSARGFGVSSLMVNDQQQGAMQTVSASSSRLTFDLNSGMRIGPDIRSLQLFFRGFVQIEEVAIEIETRGGVQIPPSGPLRFEQVVNQRLYDTNGVGLGDLMNIPSQFSDRVVDAVELRLRNSDIGVRLKLCQVVQDRFQTVNCAAPITINSGSQLVRLTSVNFAKLKELSLASRMGMIDIDRIAIFFK